MKTILATLALGAAVVSSPALSQDSGRGGGFMQHDQTRQQAQQRAELMFQMLDANHDGAVTRAEAQQAAAQFAAQRGDNGGRGAGRMQRMIDQAFGTTDSLTLQQFQAQSLARFDAQDLNHDGTVTAAERQQIREQRAQAQPAIAPAQPPRQ